jgi:prepilin-type N-terminal cleavage/methylation domain-containing protein
MIGRTQGFSLAELMTVLGISAVLTATAIPLLSAGVGDIRARAAARHIASLCQRTRADAIRRSVSVAIRINLDARGYRYATYVDGNGNGVRTTDITAGVDPQIAPDERLADHFPGVEFGVTGGLPGIEPGDAPPGTDPIALGRSDLLTFTPIGTSSSGTLYILGAGGRQYAVRALGATGRIRVLGYSHAESRWRAQ